MMRSKTRGLVSRQRSPVTKRATSALKIDRPLGIAAPPAEAENMAEWHFAEQRLDDVDDETTVSKNFARESRKLAGVFVREFFQNVLDARVGSENGQRKAPHVRIEL